MSRMEVNQHHKHPLMPLLLMACSLIELGAQQRHCCLGITLSARWCSSVFSLGELNNLKRSLCLQLGESLSSQSPSSTARTDLMRNHRYLQTVQCLWVAGAQKVPSETREGNKSILFTAFTKLSQHLPKHPKCWPKGLQQGWPRSGAVGWEREVEVRPTALPWTSLWLMQGEWSCNFLTQKRNILCLIL